MGGREGACGMELRLAGRCGQRVEVEAFTAHQVRRATLARTALIVSGQDTQQRRQRQYREACDRNPVAPARSVVDATEHDEHGRMAAKAAVPTRTLRPILEPR